MTEENLENKSKRNYQEREKKVKTKNQEEKGTRRKKQEEGKTTRPYHKRNSNSTKNTREKVISTQKVEKVEAEDEKHTIERKKKEF